MKEKFEVLAKTIYEKDDIIKELAVKVKLLEEKVFANDDTVDLNNEKTELNNTFLNPSVGVSCEKCDFIAKSKGGLQLHIKAIA